MHYITKFGLGAVAVILLGACGSDSKSTTTTPTTKAATTTVAAAAGPTTTVKSSTSGTTTTVKSSTSGTTTTVKSSTAPTTTVKSSSATTTAAAGAATTGSDSAALATTTLGKVVVDNEGRTLYLYTKDTQNKPSTCVDTCATTFPPETATGTPTAGTGLDTAKLTVIKRADGSEQLAYNGWPLYRYEKDAKSGDTTGQAVGGVWYVVDATGNAIK